MKIAVLAGGLSPERNVSLTSGGLIAGALVSRGHKVALADVYVGLPDFTGDFDSLFVSAAPEKPNIADVPPDLEALIRENGGRTAAIGKNIIELCLAADVVFLALHGGMGENGQIQATLDNFGIKYTGSGYLSSAVAMDKEMTKLILRDSGVAMPSGISGTFDEVTPAAVLEKVGLPCVVKPTSCGSSVGVTIVRTASELSSAISSAKTFCDRVIVEKFIEGRELSVGILEDRVLPAIEIIPKQGFYDYKNKYKSGMTEEVCPAPLTERETSLVSSAARIFFEKLRLRGYARVDMILEKNTGIPYCLEVNTLPGMTPMSLLPQEAAAVGIDYPDLCERIVNAALK